jgi:hypothetical protein
MKSYPINGKLNLVPLHVLEGSGNLLFEENRRPAQFIQPQKLSKVLSPARNLPKAILFSFFFTF